MAKPKQDAPLGTKTANDRQVGGEHYITAGIQPWDFTVANNLDFFQGNVIKYVSRCWAKASDVDGVLQDLAKARHYLDKYEEEIRAGRINYP